MKRKEQDILQEPKLRETPFNAPENYFSKLNENLKGIPKQSKVVTMKHWTTLAAVAAGFALLITAGGMFLKWPDRHIASFAEAHEITNEDIIEYLIYTGVEVEDLEDLNLY